MKNRFLLSLCSFSSILLILYLASFIFNARLETFFILGNPSFVLDIFLTVLSPWVIPLFVSICGIISATYIKNHSTKEFVKAHIIALLIPFAAGIIFVSPILFFIGKTYFIEDASNFFEYFFAFFKNLIVKGSLMSTYAGSTIWLLLFLFVFAMVSLCLFLFVKKTMVKTNKPVRFVWILLIGFVFCFVPIDNPIYLNWVENFFAFLLGFFVLSEKKTQETICINRHWLVSFMCMLITLTCVVNIFSLGGPILNHLVKRFLTWFGILAPIAICMRYFNNPNEFFTNVGKAFFSFFYFSSVVVVLVGYLVLKIVQNPLFAYPSICILSLLFIFLIDKIIKYSKIAIFIFGTKSKLMGVLNED